MKIHFYSARLSRQKWSDCLSPTFLFVQMLILFLLFDPLPLAAQPLTYPPAMVQEEPDATPPRPAETLAIKSANPDAERITCFNHLWSAYQEDVWFYDENNQRILPEPDLDWMVVRLADSGEQTNSGAPGIINQQSPDFDSFNEQYSDYFSHFLHDPVLAPAMAAYRLRRDLPQKVFQTLMTQLQEDRQVMYAHPAWKIAGVLYVPLERIEVIWKTGTEMNQRHTLRQEIGAVESDDISLPNRQKITINPCQLSVWQAANLLAEDIRVVQAWPLLMPLVPPVSVQFSLDMNGATAGTPIPFTFEIQFTDKVKIESSTIANLNLKPRDIFHNLYDIRYDAPLSTVDLSRNPIRITGQMKIYATGDYSLPEIPIYYTDSGAPKTNIQLIKTTEIPIRIAAMIPETLQKPDLLVSQPNPLPALDSSAATRAKQRNVLLMLAGVGLICLAGTTAAWLWRDRRQQPVQPKNHTLIRKHAAANAAILIVQHHPGLKEVAGLGFALKNYLAEFAGLDENHRGGAHTAFFHRIDAALPDACRTSTAELLSIIDEILARGDQTAIPASLTEQATRLIEELRTWDKTTLDFPEKH